MSMRTRQRSERVVDQGVAADVAGRFDEYLARVAPSMREGRSTPRSSQSRIHVTDSVHGLSASLAGRYHVERQIGAGGMATVYLARDERHDRRVAVKVLRPELAAAIGSSRFLREIKLTANLHHPHILPLYDSGEADGAVFYVMPYVEGESLRARLSREKQLPVDEALRITRAVAGALEYAHRHGVIHRDIKPENILLSGDAVDRPGEWQPLVADFGIALAVESIGHTRLTQSGLSVGTPSYMSPEQASAERQVDARSDVYALGAVLHEMLAGEPPFSGPTARAILSKVMTEHPAPLIAQRATVPPHVEAAVLRALAKVPADRFPSAAQFAEALAERHDTPGTPFISGAPANQRAWMRYAPWLVATAATVVAIILGMRGRPSDERMAVITTTILPPPGEEFSDRWSFGALSPDGRHFAFITRSSESRSRLWVRDLDKLDSRVISGADGADTPFWSPDSRSIAFFQGGQLWRIDAAGGVPVLICDAPFASPGDWGRDDTILFTAQDGIRRVAASGGEPRLVLKASKGQEFVRPSFAADEKHAVFTDASANTIRWGDLDHGTSTILLSGATDVSFISPAFVTYTLQGSTYDPPLYLQRVDAASGRLTGTRVPVADQVRSAWNRMAYSVTRGGLLAFLPGGERPRILITDRRGTVIDTIRTGGTFSAQEAHDARWLALSGAQGLWLYETRRGSGTLLNTGDNSFSPVWSPDDSAIAYSRACRIASVTTAGTRPQVLVTPAAGECLRVSDWTASGNRVIYWTDLYIASRKSEIRSYTIGDGTTESVLAGNSNVSEGVVSPDGRLLAYVSDESGRPEIYLRRYRAAGVSSQVSRAGGRTPLWSNGGRELLFQTPGGEVMSAAVGAGGGEVEIRPAQILFRATGWGRNSFSQRITPSFTVSADGRRFYLTRTFVHDAAVLRQNILSLLSTSSPDRK
jgi:serine/threonine-protein kinase